MTRVRYEKRDHAAYVTIDRPEVLNALDLQTHEELRAVWDDFERDAHIRVGVLTGAGDRSFSVGQDLKELARLSAEGVAPSSFGSGGRAGAPRLTERFDRTKPLIARVNGYAYGGGFELALACDVIVAAEHATFALPEAKLGLVPGAGGLFRLMRQIPLQSAMAHILTGRPMTAARAYELGLVSEVVPLDRLDDAVESWVRDVVRCSPASIRVCKEVASTSAHLSLADAFRADYASEKRRLASGDAIEGPRAFVEKREPRWEDE